MSYTKSRWWSFKDFRFRIAKIVTNALFRFCFILETIDILITLIFSHFILVHFQSNLQAKERSLSQLSSISRIVSGIRGESIPLLKTDMAPNVIRTNFRRRGKIITFSLNTEPLLSRANVTVFAENNTHTHMTSVRDFQFLRGYNFSKTTVTFYRYIAARVRTYTYCLRYLLNPKPIVKRTGVFSPDDNTYRIDCSDETRY